MNGHDFSPSENRLKSIACRHHLQLVLLLPTRNFPKLLLRHTLEEALQPAKHLLDALAIQGIALGLLDQRLDLDQALAIEMIAQPLLHLTHDAREKAVAEVVCAIAAHVKDGINEARVQQLVAGNLLAHDERFVGFCDAEAAYEAEGGITFCDEAERGKRGEEEGVWGGVDEVGEGDEGGGEADGGAVERGHEDVGVRVEGVGDVEVVGDKGLEPHLALVKGGCVGLGAKGYVGAAV